jgi:anti-anti-sigma factor
MTTITVESDVEGVRVARLSGDIDASHVAELKLKLLGSVRNEDLGLVVDLAGTTYIDSAGVRLLFDLGERLLQRGQALRVAAPPDVPIRRVLAITKLDTLVAVDDDAEVAAAAIAASRSR